MSAKRWLSCLCFLAACGGSDGGPSGETGGAYPWGTQNQNSADAKLSTGIRAVGGTGATAVTVALYVKDGSERITLGAGDRLTARIDDRERALVLGEDLLSGDVVYMASLPGDAPGTRVEVTLESEQWGDARAELVLPDRVTMTAPVGDAPPDLDEPVEVTWSGGQAADYSAASYAVRCGASFTAGSEGSSRETQSTELEIQPPTQGPCTLRVGVERQKYGTLEGSWGGSALGVQSDEKLWNLP